MRSCLSWRRLVLRVAENVKRFPRAGPPQAPSLPPFCALGLQKLHLDAEEGHGEPQGRGVARKQQLPIGTPHGHEGPGPAVIESSRHGTRLISSRSVLEAAPASSLHARGPSLTTSGPASSFPSQLQSVEAFLNGPIEVMRQRIIRGTSALSARQLALSGHRGTITHHDFLSVRPSLPLQPCRALSPQTRPVAGELRTHREMLLLRIGHGLAGATCLLSPAPFRRLPSSAALQSYQHQIPAAVTQMIQRISLNRLTVSAWLAQVSNPAAAAAAVCSSDLQRLVLTRVPVFPPLRPTLRRISTGRSATGKCRLSWRSRRARGAPAPPRPSPQSRHFPEPACDSRGSRLLPFRPDITAVD